MVNQEIVKRVATTVERAIGRDVDELCLLIMMKLIEQGKFYEPFELRQIILTSVSMLLTNGKIILREVK